MGDALRIGVVGYGLRTNFNKARATNNLNEAFDRIITKHPNAREIWVVSKLINDGIPRLAYDIALGRLWEIAGIAPAEVSEQDWYPIETSYISLVGAVWGDESEALLERIDVLVRVGGGVLARRETTRFKNHGGEVYEYELDLLPGRPRS